MSSYFRILFLLFVSTHSLYGIGHDSNGTHYDDEGIEAYQLNKHGLDGSIFLDPYVTSELENLGGKSVLDAGCGSGPWAVLCAQKGATVWGIDIQEGMIDRAKKAALEAGVQDKVHLAVGSVDQLPYEDNTFDRAVSLNVGCNLPNDIFEQHIEEMYRCLKPGGMATVTAPASFGVLFTEDVDREEVMGQINTVLNTINEDPTPERIAIELNSLTTVLRATFVEREGLIRLVTDESELVEGEDIWRKIPGLAVPNRYHAEEAYHKISERAGFTVTHVDRATGEHPGLSEDYKHHNVYAVFHLTKPS